MSFPHINRPLIFTQIAAGEEDVQTQNSAGHFARRIDTQFIARHIAVYAPELLNAFVAQTHCVALFLAVPAGVLHETEHVPVNLSDSVFDSIKRLSDRLESPGHDSIDLRYAHLLAHILEFVLGHMH